VYHILLIPGLIACTAGGGGDVLTGPEVRVDHASEGVESTGSMACLGDDGRLHVVWTDDRLGFDAVFYNRSIDGGTSFSASDRQLNQPVGDHAARSPVIGCVGERVYAVWEDLRDSSLDNPSVYFQVSDDGGDSWLAEDMSLDGDEDEQIASRQPQLAVAGSGLWVTWFDSRNGAYDVYVNASTDAGGTWLGEPTRVDTDGAGDAWSGSPHVATDGAGLVVVAWEDLRSGWSDVRVNTSTDYGISWAHADTRLDTDKPAGVDSFHPRAAAADGRAYVAWHSSAEGVRADVALAVAADGRTWSETPLRAPSTEAFSADARYPQLAAEGQDVWLAWQDDRAGGYDIFLRRSADGGETWAADESRLERDFEGEAQSYDPRILAPLAGEDLLIVLWHDRRYDEEQVGFDDLFYNYSENRGETWAAFDLRIDGSTPGSAWAIDPWLGRVGDTLHFVWSDGRSGSGDVLSHVLPVGEETEPISVPAESLDGA
jgi:hypothetical protein